MKKINWRIVFLTLQGFYFCYLLVLEAERIGVPFVLVLVALYVMAGIIFHTIKGLNDVIRESARIYEEGRTPSDDWEDD